MSFLDRFIKEDPNLEAVIAEAYTDLKGRDYETEEAEKIIARLTELHALKKKRVDPNTVLISCANIGIVATIIMFEKHHIITTKAPSFLMKFGK